MNVQFFLNTLKKYVCFQISKRRSSLEDKYKLSQAIWKREITLDNSCNKEEYSGNFAQVADENIQVRIIVTIAYHALQYWSI